MGFYYLFQTKTTCFGHKIMTTSCENDYFHVICESICMSAIVIPCLHNLHQKTRNYLEIMKANSLPS